MIKLVENKKELHEVTEKLIWTGKYKSDMMSSYTSSVSSVILHNKDKMIESILLKVYSGWMDFFMKTKPTDFKYWNGGLRYNVGSNIGKVDYDFRHEDTCNIYKIGRTGYKVEIIGNKDNSCVITLNQDKGTYDRFTSIIKEFTKK